MGGTKFFTIYTLLARLASKIKCDCPAKEGGKPFTFMQAAAFQYVNPKAWVMVISANASFTLAGEGYWLSVALIVIAYALVGFPSISIWAGFGQYIRRFLDNPRILKTFNVGMSVLTAACVVFIWLD